MSIIAGYYINLQFEVQINYNGSHEYHHYLRFKKDTIFNNSILFKMYIPKMTIIPVTTITATIAGFTVGTVDVIGNTAFCKE